MSTISFILACVMLDRSCTPCKTDENLDPKFIDNTCQKNVNPCSKITSDTFYAFSILGMLEVFTLFSPFFFMVCFFLKINKYKKLALLTSIISMYILVLNVYSNISLINTYSNKINVENTDLDSILYIVSFIIVAIYLICILIQCLRIYKNKGGKEKLRKMFNEIIKYVLSCTTGIQDTVYATKTTR